MSPWQHAYEAAVERMPDARVRWRALGTLYVAGGFLGLLSLLMPHPAVVDEPVVAAVSGLAIVVGLVMAFGRPLLQTIWVFAFLVFGAALVSVAVWATHDHASPYAFFYVWVAFEACFFLPRRPAIGAVMLAAAFYAVALMTVSDGTSGAIGHWLIAMGTTVVVGLLAAVLRERSDRLIDQLGEAARTDPLTGLLNRRGFQEVMEGRFHGQLTLLFADLDHFKALNDRFGHHVGDDVLRRCGELFSAVAPHGGAAARTGGEEFAIVLPGWSTAQAYELAEGLRRTVRELIAPGGRGLTISIGVASSPEHADTVEDLMRAADKALYLGKQLGRDRTVVFSSEAQVANDLRPGEAARSEQAAAVLVLAEALDVRDGGTAEHSRTVGRYAEQTARQLGLPPESIERVRLAGIVHDIGKIGVPDHILRKPGKLSTPEWREICKHPELGARILIGAGLEDIAAWVVAHHERLDGEGYPFGVLGAYIPLEARILAVTDAYEAMTSDRVYRGARSHAEAASELRRCAGTQFDPDVVQALLTSIELPQQGEVRDTGYQPVS